MTIQQIKLLRLIADAILSAIVAGGSMGAPAGTLYAALIGKISLGQFEQIMSGLEETGLVTKTGQVYHVTPKGAAFTA